MRARLVKIAWTLDVTCSHSVFVLLQLQGYVNRYGPGMVIYWFGHVAHLSSDSDIFITDSFPPEITLPGAFDPLASVTKLKEGDKLTLQPAKIQTEFDDDWNPITTCELEENSSSEDLFSQ
ncbi:unnamed protein product [Phytophthora lilii]|uniref:CDAN1-interacting nuclease 1 n=1 Tax=Phytophthora lilii TaxID=2077276 RepID=A0A9W6WVP3_9STRA|nr:unnamed protein product [Phytophthora lilii]